MEKYPKPIIVTSKCFEFDACRYNGQMIPNNFVQKLEPFVQFRPVCPEMEIGLGTPRDPIRIVNSGDGRTLVQPTTGRDLTGIMEKFAVGWLGSLGEADGFILKSRSPSCAITDAKEFPGMDNRMTNGKGPGLFAEKVLEKFPGAAIEDEGRLMNFRIREHFLTRVFTFARFRQARTDGTASALVGFHADNKYVLMTYNQNGMRELGRIVANMDKKDTAQNFESYGEKLRAVTARAPRQTSAINTLMHALGYFKDALKPEEKAFFLDLLDGFRNRKIPLSAVTTVLQSWIIKYEVGYLARQTFFSPYPRELVEITDSGKGRAV